MPEPVTRYRTMKHRNDIKRELGFDYRGKVLLRTTDRNIYVNDIVRGFSLRLEDIINEWFYATKSIKKFFNYVVDKHTNDIN